MTVGHLLLVCAVTAAWAVSFGVGSQAVSHWLKAHEASDTLLGVVHAVYYLGVAVASRAVPPLPRRLGLACTTLGMLLSVVSLAVFPAGAGAAGWLIIRFLSGAG